MNKILTTLALLLLVFTNLYAGEKVTFFHNDALGSPIAATDINGELLWKEAYMPYGARLNKNDDGTNTQWFTGKPHDEDIGLSYFGARWYDPTTGRFMGIDPVGVDVKNMHSFNRYAYANNNPYKYIDPDGRFGILLNEFKRGEHKLPTRDMIAIGNLSNKLTATAAVTAVAGPPVVTIGGEAAVIKSASKILPLVKETAKQISKNKEVLKKAGCAAGVIAVCGSTGNLHKLRKMGEHLNVQQTARRLNEPTKQKTTFPKK